MTKYESTFLSNVPQFSRQIYLFIFLEGSHASRISPYGKRNMQTEMSMERWWNDTDWARISPYGKRNMQTEMSMERWWNDTDWAHISPYGKRNMQTEMSMEYWWNDTDWGKPRYSEENLAQCQFIINLTWTVLGSHPSLSVDRLVTKCLTYL